MNCTHTKLSTKKFLSVCPDCEKYFVIKQVYVIAANNGGKKGLKYQIIPSNELGWYLGEPEDFSS